MSGCRLTNLSYLTEITGGESMVMKEMLEIFIAQVPELKSNMTKFLSEKRYDQLGKEAHKAKSSVLVVGMDDLGARLKELQLLTEKREKIDEYSEYVEEFVVLCDRAVTELSEDLKSL